MVLLVALPQNAGIDAKNLKERKMQKSAIEIRGVPAAVWENRSEKVYIYAHGQCGSKEDAELLASVVCEQGRQVISFDLSEHGQSQHEPASCESIFMIRGALFWNFAKFYRTQGTAGTRSRCLPLA